MEETGVVGLGTPPQLRMAMALGAGGGFSVLWDMYQKQPRTSSALMLPCDLLQGI